MRVSDSVSDHNEGNEMMNTNRMMIAVRRLLAEYLHSKLTQAQQESEHAPVVANYVEAMSDEAVEGCLIYLSETLYDFDLYWRWNTHTNSYEVDVLHRRK